MSKHEAVDRLMALATEKRADPALPRHAVQSEPLATRAQEQMVVVPGSSVQEIPLKEEPHQTNAVRGRQVLNAIRPLLPALAGAMRLVDHGAVQAVARLLPLLGASTAAPFPKSPGPGIEEDAQSRTTAELQSSSLGLRKDVDALAMRVASADDLLGRTRTGLERIAAEQAAGESETRALADRVRLLTAGLIILLMLVIAEMILLVTLFHR